MDVSAVVIKLKEGAMSNVEPWKNEMLNRKDEAIQTLKAEGVTLESWFHLELEGQNYLIAYMRANDLSHAREVVKTSPFEIDKIHKKFKENWEKGYTAKLLFDLENN